MSVDTLIRKALDAGVELAVVDGAIKVIGHRSAVHQWRDRLRTHKAEIFRHLTATTEPEPAIDWQPLAASYHAHHFNCPTCIASARGKGYGLRCGSGATLWATYQNAAIQPTKETP